MATDPQMFIRIAANIEDLKTAMAQARQAVLDNTAATAAASAASADWSTTLDHLGSTLLVSVTSGQLLVDAILAVGEAVKGAAEALPELALQGAVIGDVTAAFDRLTAQAGLLGDVLLGTLQAGTHGTIDDFDLMKTVNRDLAAGMDLTTAQFGLLSQGAFALAKATGGDVADALASMNDAMLTGRVRALALLTGKIDLTAAELAFAESLGGTTAQLTAEGKMEADREAILAAVEAALGRLGDQSDNLKDRVTQGEVAWKNFEDQLGVTLAHSPVLAAAFDSVETSLAAAFGSNQQILITAIAGAVDAIAIKVVDFGIAAGLMASELVMAWNLIAVPILAVETLIVGLVTVVGEAVLASEKLAGAMHIVSPADLAAITDTQVQLRAMTVSLADQTAEAAKGVVGNSALGKSLDTATGSLLLMRDGMIAAQGATVAGGAAATAFVGPIQQAGAATGVHAAYLKDAKEKTDAFAKAMIDIASVGAGWQGTLDTIDGSVVEAIKYYLAAGVAQNQLAIAYGLTAAQVKAVASELAGEVAAQKLEAASVLEVTKLWDDYAAVVASDSGSAYDKAGAAIDKWYDDTIAKNQKAKTDTAAFYDAIAALDDAKWAHLNLSTLQADVTSQQHYQKLASDAQAAYDFALATVASHTTAEMQILSDNATATALTAQRWTASFSAAIDTVTQSDYALAVAQDKVNAGLQAEVTTTQALTAAKQAQQSVQTTLLGTTWTTDPSKFADVAALTTAFWQTHTAMTVSQYEDAEALFAVYMHQHGYADGVQNAPGGWAMVGERGPEAMYVPPGANIYPTGSSPAGGGLTVNVYVTQPLGTPAAIGAAVGPALLQVARNLGLRLPAGV